MFSVFFVFPHTFPLIKPGDFHLQRCPETSSWLSQMLLNQLNKAIGTPRRRPAPPPCLSAGVGPGSVPPAPCPSLPPRCLVLPPPQAPSSPGACTLLFSLMSCCGSAIQTRVIWLSLTLLTPTPCRPGQQPLCVRGQVIGDLDHVKLRHTYSALLLQQETPRHKM